MQMGILNYFSCLYRTIISLVFLTNEIIILKYWLVVHGLLQELAQGLHDLQIARQTAGQMEKLCCTCTSYSLVPSLAIRDER